MLEGKLYKSASPPKETPEDFPSKTSTVPDYRSQRIAEIKALRSKRLVTARSPSPQEGMARRRRRRTTRRS